MNLLLPRRLVFLTFLAIGGTAHAAVTYDALGDFSTSLNPNGVWTFGRATAANGGTFTAFDDHVLDASVYSVWRDNEHLSAGTPSVWKRTDLNTLNFHPGPGGALDAYTIIRFTAPSAGSYNYSAMFASDDSGSKSVQIFHNSIGLFSSIIGGVETASDSDVVDVAPGDTIDVVVGPNGGYENDSTRVSFSLEAVPEPGTTLMLGLSGLALGVKRRRQAD